MSLKYLKQLALVSVLFSANVLAAPEWLRDATIGGTYLYNAMDDTELHGLLDQRVSEGVSVLEFDSRLSDYLSDAEFDKEVIFLDRAAKAAHERNMNAVIYFPSLEVLTADGVTNPSSMYKDHPDWVQRGISGDANVFYGNQEVWVDENTESAWMSPNSPYKDYFIDRVRKLAATELDGIWLDVPIYIETGAGWAGTGTYAAADFKQWSIDEGIGGASGYTMPTEVDFTAPAFRAWVKWRHVNLANFIEDIRIAAHEVNPDFAILIENYPMDYMDATRAGLDATAFKMSENVVQVLETDSVSNETAMQWANPEDFESKITMLKWGKAINYGDASWSFAYGNEVLDSGLTLASMIGTATAPFESKTPDMLVSVGTDHRAKWFGYIRNHSDELLLAKRKAKVGVWYSSASRDFNDFIEGGEYGMFPTVTNPNNDPAWWSQEPSDSTVWKPHLGGYRGMSSALMRLHIPYKVVTAPGRVATEMQGLDMMILPSVVAISEADATALENYVSAGGVVLATGALPGVMDEYGATLATNRLATLFGFNVTTDSHVNTYGKGLAVYRSDIQGANVFELTGGVDETAYAMEQIELLTRIHTDEPFTVENAENIYIDHGETSDLRKHLYFVNYAGLQQPLVSFPKSVSVYYNAGDNYQLTAASLSSPDGETQLSIINQGHGVYRIEVPVDQFALVNLDLAQVVAPSPEVYNGPVFADAAQQEAAESGLQFILNSMRNTALPRPYNFGVQTNLLDNSNATNIYTNGHHVTGEHMGLLLRTAACMKDETAYDQAFEYVRDAMASPLYHVANWSVDKLAQRPFIENHGGEFWYNANAPLDDLRIIRGLIDGNERLGRSDSEELAKSMLEGLYWTTVTTNNQVASEELSEYPGGLLGFAWDWSETNDASLTPPSIASGMGSLGYDLIPIDYQELGTIGLAAQRDHRWGSVLSSATQLLLDAEINNTGLFYNGYESAGNFTGDFEYQGATQGGYLKTIQVLWQGIHLARVSKFDNTYLSNAQLAASAAAAQRSLNYYKTYYATNGNVPEYMTFDGAGVPDCNVAQVTGCLVSGEENLLNGEVRIYAQIARLALLLDDKAFANQIINEKIMSDRISDPADARYGLIGNSTTADGDAEAWNILESVFSLCLNASNEIAVTASNENRSPVAVTDSYTVVEGVSLQVTSAALLSNDTDNDDDALQVTAVSIGGSQGGSLLPGSDGSWSYTAAVTVSGVETFTYTISDGNGGIAKGTIFIINPTAGGGISSSGLGNEAEPVDTTTQGVVFAPSSVVIQTGELDYGDIAFLTADDSDTYDINSILVGAEHSLVWNASQTIPNPGQVQSIRMLLSGSYSVSGVTQTTSMYNFRTGAWVDFDTRVVGDDAVVAITADSEFRSAEGLVQVRVQASRSAGSFTSWANSLKWDVTYSGSTSTGSTPVNSGGSVSNSAVGITLNGNLTEWANAVSFGVDPDDVSEGQGPLDWRQAWLANDGGNFYLAFSNYGAVTESWGQTIYIDTDLDNTTGWQSGLSIGADYVIQGSVIYSYSGDAAGTVWQWDLVEVMTGSNSNGVFEWRFPRASLGDPQEMYLAFVGSNEAYGGTVEDSYPDGVYDTTSAVRAFSYAVAATGNTAPVATNQSVQLVRDETLEIALAGSDFDGDSLSYSIVSVPTNGSVLQGAGLNLTYVPVAGFSGSDRFSYVLNDGQAQSDVTTVTITVLAYAGAEVLSNQVTSITLDGNLNDWQGLSGFTADFDEHGGSINPVDYLSAAAAHNEASLFLNYQNDATAISGIDSQAFNVFLDTDASASRGYRGSMDIGAEFLLQGSSLYQYEGDGISWAWLYRGEVQRAVSGSNAEVMIDRSALGDPSTINLVFVGDNLAIGGSINDLYPGDAYEINSAVRHFSYSLNGVAAQAQNTLGYNGSQSVPVSGLVDLYKNATQPTLLTPKSTSKSGGGAIGYKWLIVLGAFIVGLFLRRR